MRVFGDRILRTSGADVLARLRDDLRRVAALPPGLARHSLLVALLIDAGMLAQALADTRFEATGIDAVDGDDDAMALTSALARCCTRSWTTGFRARGRLPLALLARCEARRDDRPLSLKVPEGYAFYALYPELHAEAALRCRSSAPRWRVVGLRSIGTSLAAMVAAGLGAPPPRSLRPVGHPFDRQIVATAVRRVDRGTAFAIVDEGPGLSGSSMAAAARWLRAAGVPTDRLHFFPGHAGAPGPQADAAVRALWATIPGRHRGFDAGILQAPAVAHRLATWVEGLVGPLLAPLKAIGGGGWRGLQARADGAPVPPAHPWQERLKYLAFTREGTWLVKFAGLGRAGERAFARARALGAAGFTPAPAGWCHGFLVERWRDDLRPLPARLPAAARAGLIGRVGDYLAFRARNFPARADDGASVEVLLAMTRDHAEAALGAGAGGRCTALERAFRDRAPALRRVETDNRMHRWEWLAGASLLLKTDAVDHAAAHDLVGCQDIAWDVAGAQVELGLTPAEVGTLVERVRRQGVAVEASLVGLLRPCYLAFQWGHFALAVESAAGAGEADRKALVTARERYREALRTALRAGPGG